MKIPKDVLTEIADLGQRIMSGDGQLTEVGHDGAVWLRDEYPDLALAVLEDWACKRVKSWLDDRRRAALAEVGAHENGTLPFPKLHPHLEVMPGILKHQLLMTGADWDRTLAIHRNRCEQAEALFLQVERSHKQVRPLLSGEMTTNDVLAQLGPDAESASGQSLADGTA